MTKFGRMGQLCTGKDLVFGIRRSLTILTIAKVALAI